MLKHRMILAGVAAVLIVVITGAVVLAVWGFTRDDPSYQVTVTTYPQEVDLQMGAAEAIAHSGTVTYTVDDDELTIAATREEFASHSETIELSEDVITEVDITLDPQTEAAEELRREDSDYYQGQADFTQESLDDAEELYQTNEILQQLPEEAETFRAYAGVPEDDDHEFGVHVYVYDGNETQGEEDFTAWVEEEGFDPAELDVTTHVDDAAPIAAPEAPTADELAQVDQPDVESFTADPEGLSADELAIEFLTIANTHDATQEDSPTAAQIRAADLMTDELSDNLGVVENPSVPPNWWDAMDAEAVSFPWIYEISDERSSDQGRVHYSARVCWAWIPAGGGTPVLDNPRSWSLVVAEDDTGTYRVTDYSYQDAYHGDDPDEGICGQLP